MFLFLLASKNKWDTGARSRLGKEEEEEAEGQAAVEEVVGHVGVVVVPQVEDLAEVDSRGPREHIRLAGPHFHRQSAACEGVHLPV